MPHANLLLLVAVLLPPRALDILGDVVEERTILTPYGDAGPLALRVRGDGLAVWVQPYTGLPTRTDPRATLYAAQQLGVQRVLNWDAGIALNPVLRRGEPVVVTDYIGWTARQADSFFTTAPLEMDSSAASVRTAFCPQMAGSLGVRCCPAWPRWSPWAPTSCAARLRPRRACSGPGAPTCSPTTWCLKWGWPRKWDSATPGW
jgi:hypothetical protein